MFKINVFDYTIEINIIKNKDISVQNKIDIFLIRLQLLYTLYTTKRKYDQLSKNTKLNNTKVIIKVSKPNFFDTLFDKDTDIKVNVS